MSISKISLLAAINVADNVVVGGYEIDSFTVPAGATASEAIELSCSDEHTWIFDEQEVELDESEGVITAVDRDGESHVISVMMKRPLSHAAVQTYLQAKARSQSAREHSRRAD